MARRSVRAATVAGMLFGGLVTATPAHADTPVACSETDLRNAITAAAAGDTLSLASYCVYTLTDAGGGELLINKDLNFTGNHATIKRDPTATSFRVLEVASAAVSLDTLTVMNGDVAGGGGGVLVTGTGSLTGTGLSVLGSHGSGSGGGLRVDANATMTLTDSLVQDNRAVDGAGIFALGTTVLIDTTLNGNRATGVGGGLATSSNGDNTLTLTGGVISNNTATSGGGIELLGSSDFSATGTTFKNNRATRGGALSTVFAANATLTNATLSGNSAVGTTSITPQGGAIYAIGNGFTVTLDNTTVTGNKTIGASGQGAGIWAINKPLNIGNGTVISGNLASGRYSQGAALYTTGDNTVTIDSTTITGNKTTGTGSISGGIYNSGRTYALTNSSITDNIAPLAPAPGGIYTTVAIAPTGTTITGNTPTNCLLSPATVTGCIN